MSAQIERATSDKGCFFIFLLIVLIVFGFLGYITYLFTPFTALEPEKILVEQVMEHSPGSYSIKYLAENNELKEINLFRNVTIFVDVPEGQAMFALLHRGKTPSGDTRYIDRNEIHIHSAREINGAGWDFGKQGSGQTVVIEAQ